MHLGDLVPDGTRGSSSVAAEGKTKYMDTEAAGEQVDPGENLWKCSSDCFCPVNKRGNEVIIEKENGRGGIGGEERAQNRLWWGNSLWLSSSMKGTPEGSSHDFKVRPVGLVCWL